MANLPCRGGGDVVVEHPRDVAQRRDGTPLEEIPVLVGLVGDSLRTPPAAHQVDDGVHGPGLEP